MRRKLLRKRALIPVVAALAMCGIAAAAWFVTTAGDAGRGKLGSIAAPTVTAVTTPSDAVACFPGQTCSLEVQVNNPNSTPLKLTSVDYAASATLMIEKPLGTSIAGSCTPTNFSFPDPLTGLTVSVPPGTSTVTIPGAYVLDANAPNACQGAIVWMSGSANTWTFSTP